MTEESISSAVLCPDHVSFQMGSGYETIRICNSKS